MIPMSLSGWHTSKQIKRLSSALLSVGTASLIFPAETQGQASVIKGGTRAFDLHSTHTVSMSVFEGKDIATIVLVGDSILLELDNGGTLELNAIDANDQYRGLRRTARNTNCWIMMLMMESFKKQQKQIIGQANLTLKVNPERTCEIVTKTIYVPGCEPYSTGTPVPPRIQQFLDQVKSAVAAIEAEHLNLPAPNVKAQVVEIVIGRDPEVFPRFATPFEGRSHRGSDGKVIQDIPFVREYFAK